MLRYKFCCLLFVIAVLTAACSSENLDSSRPASVPKEAMWIGGMDGGAWVLLQKRENQPAHIYHAEIFGDQAGDPWYFGRLEVMPNSQPDVPLDDPKAFGVWDGDNLLLQDGRSMRAIDTFEIPKQ